MATEGTCENYAFYPLFSCPRLLTAFPEHLSCDGLNERDLMVE